jgi:hypothetical protein
MARSIIFSPLCDIAATALGGYERIDVSLEAVMQGLMVNPYGFRLIESDFYQARYLVTNPIRDLPSLVWVFTIDPENNVILTHVEEFQDY